MKLIGLALSVMLASAPAQSPPGPARFPKPSEGKLDNGLHLIILEQKDRPFVSFLLSIPGAGGYRDADGADMLARATADLMRAGTTSRFSTGVR